VRLVINPLRVQRHVSRQKPLRERAFGMDLTLCLETRSVDGLDIVCERVREVEHAKLLT
jgi:hypothetical protein